MKSKMPIRLTLILSILAATSVTAETRRYLVVPSSETAASRLRIANDPDSIAQRRVRALRNIGTFALDLTAAEAAELRSSPGIDVVEPVVERFAFGAPAPGAVAAHVSRYAQQVTPWGIEMLRAAKVWSVTRGETINVAVVDTGIEPDHPDLAHAYRGGHNTFNRFLPPFDDNTHGTHVAGTIAAADNGFGVVGVAPGVLLWSVKVLDRTGAGTSETVAEGIDWVVGASRGGGRWVINLSLGSSDRSVAEERAVREALAAGIVIVAATGNDGMPAVSYPARYPGVIAVGAVDEQSLRPTFSSYGAEMSVLAPGVRVASTVLDGVRRVAELEVPLGTYDAWAVGGSPMATISGDIVDCGLGLPQHIPSSVNGRIALIQRGEITFREKARNAKEAGAIAVIIWNHEPEETPNQNWVMVISGEKDPYWTGYAFPLTIGVPRLVGERLQGTRSEAEVSIRFERYAPFNGTSMATPHVTGVVALLLALDPSLTAPQIKDVIERTARDIYTPGRDNDSAWGVVDALSAARYVDPVRLPTPPPPGPRRRAVR